MHLRLGGTVLALAVTVTGTTLNTCCNGLAANAALKGKVLTPGTAAYNQSLTEYYSANAAQDAWCIVMPEATSDVQAIAKIISTESCPFGIKAGGHSAWKGSNGIENGVTIDFSYMNTTTYSNTTGIVQIQPGARWGSVYDKLEEYNRTTAGARTSVVGVGGFTSGAGYSFHSDAHGFACDNVVNWEIVLADGSVVNANATSNPDLWKAQKGGSGNLGFITRIDQQTLNTGTELWGGFVSYNLTERDAVFNAYLNFSANTPANSPDQNIIAVYFSDNEFSLRSILTNTDGVADAPAFDQYLTIPNISTTVAVGPEAEVIPQFTGPTPLGLYANWLTGMATNSFAALNAIDTLHHEYIPKMIAAAPSSNFSTLIEFQPVTPSMVANSDRLGGNVLGLEPFVANGTVLMWLVSLTVDTEENQSKILPVCLDFINAINDAQKQQDTFVDWIYLNYAWEDEEPYTHYGSANLELLHDVSTKYDPKGVFQKLRQTGFHLPVNGTEKDQF